MKQSRESKTYAQSQNGFTLGGPVKIPKRYNGRNRLFFMSNFEGFRSRQATTAFATTMTTDRRNGDFSAIPTGLQDPLPRGGTPPNVTTLPYAVNNHIPPSRIANTSLFLMNSLPFPNHPPHP